MTKYTKTDIKLSTYQSNNLPLGDSGSLSLSLSAEMSVLRLPDRLRLRDRLRLCERLRLCDLLWLLLLDPLRLLELLSERLSVRLRFVGSSSGSTFFSELSLDELLDLREDSGFSFPNINERNQLSAVNASKLSSNSKKYHLH